MKLLTTPRTVFAVRPFAVRLLAPGRGVALLLALLALCLPSRALAHKNGEASESCGCHGGGKAPTVTITPDLMTVNPGQQNAGFNICPTCGTHVDLSLAGHLVPADQPPLNGAGLRHGSP